MEAPFPGSARSVKRPHHQQNPQESAAPFVVTGIHVLLFDDDTLAAFINSPAALLPWNGDQSLLIDRYDVRHLLQDLSGIRKRRAAPPLTDCTEDELNHERFRDLQDALSVLPVEEQRASEDLSNPLVGGYQAVAFSYSEEATENGTQTGSTHRSAGFRPPFPVPDSLKLPPSEKLHQIMVGTAKFVKEHGGQSEVLLKVKQGSNPMFGFLNVDHHLHKYYRFLMEHPELLQPVAQDNSGPEEATHGSGEGLSLLGFAYGSGDEEDDKALRLESLQGSLGAVPPSQGGLSNSNGGGPIGEKVGGSAPSDKAFAVISHKPKIGEDSQSKVNESAPRAPLSLLNKKKKGLIGPKDLIQPNKKIVSPLMAIESPRKEAADATTRLPRKSESKTSSWHSVPSIKDLDYGMSADAAAAVVLAATRGARGLKQDSSNNNKSSSSSGLSQKVLEANRHPSTVGGSKGIALLGFGQTDVRLAKAVAEAAAIAASHEADSADALLTPAEKLKAERLRKAKMFAAMIKSGKGVSESGAKLAGQLPAATSAKSDDMRADSFSGLVANGQVVANGRAGSAETKPQIEEVEDSVINKSVGAGSTDLIKRSLKERVYRKRESKEHHKSKVQGSDSEESEHQRKRKSHRDHGVDKKRRHSKRKKHRAYDSESADSGCSSGNEGKDRYSSKSHRRHHHRRTRSHHEKDERQDGKQRRIRHKICDDDLDSILPDEKHRHRKSWERGSSSSSEDEATGTGKGVHRAKHLKVAMGEGEQLPSPVPFKQSTGADVETKTIVTTEVPEEIRAKVRAMLLSTL